MIGDSTMANKPYDNDKQERGWGMMLCNYFTEDVRVDNHALNGRSSKSFIDEGHWQKVIDAVKPGDYVIIQFGHNDEKPKADRHTDPGSTFDANLKRFIAETREKGGTPILMNAVVRRNFFPEAPKNDDDEKLRDSKFEKIPENEDDTLRDTHGEYIIAPHNVAKETGCYFVDANKITHELEQGLGKIGSRKLHMWFLPGETPSEPKGKQDNTHYRKGGAYIVAGLLADAIGEEVPALKKFIRHYDATVAKDGTGLFFDPQKAVDNVVDGKSVGTVLVGAGEWNKPVIPKGKKVKFVMRKGAKWVK